MVEISAASVRSCSYFYDRLAPLQDRPAAKYELAASHIKIFVAHLAALCDAFHHAPPRAPHSEVATIAARGHFLEAISLAS